MLQKQSVIMFSMSSARLDEVTLLCHLLPFFTSHDKINILTQTVLDIYISCNSTQILMLFSRMLRRLIEITIL